MFKNAIVIPFLTFYFKIILNLLKSYKNNKEKPMSYMLRSTNFYFAMFASECDTLKRAHQSFCSISIRKA